MEAEIINGIRTISFRLLGEKIEILVATAGSDFWPKFNAEFPGADGYSTASRVGFSADRKIAVVYFSWAGCPRLGFGGVDLLFQKGDD